MMSTMQGPGIVSREEWLDARRALQAREKELTRLADWVRPRTMYGKGGSVEGNGRYHQPACACAVHESAAA